MFDLTIAGLIIGIISILTGIVIFKWPQFLAFIAATYLIIVGIVAIIYVLLR
ncbi:DUF3096 domain-containing protein [Chloroflexota bacterium]